jgi:choline dehydrogenase-like flavoprotein
MCSKNTAWYSSTLSGTAVLETAGVLLHPLSRGTVKINITHPDTEPVVDYRTLSNPLNLEILVEILRFKQQYHFNTSLSYFGPIEISPGVNVTSDEVLAGYVRNGIAHGVPS